MLRGNWKAPVRSRLTEEQARTRPAPDPWSVLECLEHVNFVERRFLRMVRESEAGPPAERDAAREAALMERVTDRSNRRTAPEAVHPAGRYRSISEALQDFNAVRDETLRFASEEGVNLPVAERSPSCVRPFEWRGNPPPDWIHTAQMREAAEGR